MHLITISLFLYSISTVLCSVINDLKNKSNRFKSARGMLMDNLQASWNEESKGMAISFTYPVGDIKNLPIDVLVHICKYLDTKSIKSFGLASKYSQNIKKHAIKMILSEINEHFVFKEDWFNELFYSVIETRIPTDISSSDPRIHDYLMLLTVDYIRNSNTGTLKIPKHLHLAIISYLNNLIYGIDEVVPLNFNGWIYSLGEKIQKYSLPLSLKYYEDYENVNCVGENFRRYYPILEFIALNCRKPEDFALYPLPGNIHDLNNLDNLNHLGRPLRMLFNNALISKEELDIPKSENILYHIVFDYGRPLDLLGKVVSNNKSWVLDAYKTTTSAWYFRDISRILRDEVTDALTYMWSCDFLKPFDIEEAQKYPDFNPERLLFELYRERIPFLLKYDILSKFIEANLVSVETLKWMKLEWFAVDLLLSNPVCTLSTLINVFNQYYIEITEERFAYMLESIPVDNPLALIFLQDYNVIYDNYEHLIKRKNFNLNVAYEIDVDVKDLLYFSCSRSTNFFINLYKMNRKSIVTLTFREIVAGMKRYPFCELFGLKSPESLIDTEKIAIIHSLRACLENPIELQLK